MAVACRGNFKYSTKSYTKINSALLPEKNSHNLPTPSSFSNKFKPQTTYIAPKWLHKTHNKIMHTAHEWNGDKKRESIEHAFNALNIQQDLYAHKRDILSQSKSKRIFSCIGYFSKEHKMGRALNQEMTHAFYPLETKPEKLKRLWGEAVFGATQPLNLLPTNIIKAFTPLPLGLSNLVTHAIATSLNPLAQQAADVVQKLSPGPMVSKPSNMCIQQTGISTSHQMNARDAQLKTIAERLKIYFSIIAQSAVLAGKKREEKLKEVDSAIEELFEAIAETDEAEQAYKGDTYIRKLKIKENIGQTLVRAAWATTITPVSKAFSSILGIPRADVLIRQGAQMVAASIDYIHAQDYIRGRHIKSPIGIFTPEAIDAGFHISMPNLDRIQARTLVLEHIACSNNCENIRKKFHAIPWKQIAGGYFSKCSQQNLIKILNSENECNCVKEFLFSPNKIQNQITHYPEKRINAIKYNAMQKMAEMQREKANLYRRLESIRKDIALKGNDSDYSPLNAKKCKVYTEKEILDCIKQNQTKQDKFDDEYRLFDQASIYAQSHKEKDIKIDPNWAYSLDELYRKYPESSILKQLKSNTRLMWKTFTNNVVRDPSMWRNETLFRQHQFPIFAVDNTLAELNKIADNLPHTDGIFHKEIVSFVANAAFFSPQNILSLWLYYENIAKFKRPKHHAFYVKVMLEKSRIVLSQNKTEKVKLENKLRDKNINYNERINIQSKLECVNFILENLPKQMASLELFNGNPQTFVNLLDKQESHISEYTKVNLANSIASMAAGLINPVSSIHKKNNAVNLQGQALELSKKINPQIQTGGINIARTLYNIKTTFNPYHGIKHFNKIKHAFEQNKTSNTFNAFTVYGSKNCPDSLTNVCFDIFNKISSDRVADKSLFISKLSENNKVIKNKIQDLYNQLSNNLTNEKRLQIYIQIRKYHIFYTQIQAFLDKMHLPVEKGGFAGIIKDTKTINLLFHKGKIQKRNIDLSVSGHYTHALERDPFLDVKALNSKKKFSWGKAKNIAKTAVMPAARFLFDELPRHILTTPITIIRGLSDLEISRKANKQTRITQEYTRASLFSKPDLSFNSVNTPNNLRHKNLTDYLITKNKLNFRLALKEGDIKAQQAAQNKEAQLKANAISNRAPRYKTAVDKRINSTIQSNGFLTNINFSLFARPKPIVKAI